MGENKKHWSAAFAGVTVIAAIALSLVVSSSTAEAADGTTARYAAGTRVTARWTGAVNTSSRDAVNAAYWSQYAPKLSLPIDWLLGSVLGCDPGLTSASTNAATLSALNYVRSLAGLAPVTFSTYLNQGAQRAALMMAANGQLDHHPSSNWRCWTSEGAAAASRSNLALAYPSLKSGQIVSLYMTDPGDSNYGVGHRRWILNPFSTVMGSGSTTTANALTVIGPTSSLRPNPRYVSWPTRGYFPSPMEPNGRWSISAGLRNISFAHARVHVYRGTTAIPVHQYPVESGYAQPTLAWQLPASMAKTGSYRVVVNRIKRAGVRRFLHYSYTVNLFTPTP